MVECRVHVVASYRVHTHVLHQGSISEAHLGVTERIAGACTVRVLSPRLVVHSQKHESVSRLRVHEFLSVHLDGVQRGRCGREGAEEDLGHAIVSGGPAIQVGSVHTDRILKSELCLPSLW